MTLTQLSPALAAPAAAPAAPAAVLGPGAAPSGPSFAERLGSAVEGLAQSQNRAADLATAFELGKEQDLAAVMVEQQVASLGFQLALNVRNKAVGAYRDIMNMSV